MKYPIDKNIVRNAIRRRSPESDKLSVGTLLAYCGSYGMAGAAIMSLRAALRSGIGLVKSVVPDSVYPILAGAVPEAVFIPYKNINEIDFTERSKYCGAVLVGCGLGQSEESRGIVTEIIEKSACSVILDADALNMISRDVSVLKKAKAPLILTPHEREFSRLSGLSVDRIRENREEIVRDFSREYGVITVLKGHITLCADSDGVIYYNEGAGNAGMAVGGSGDVLAGIMASLTAQGGDPFKCACAAVYIHAVAGDIAKERFGEISMLPTDMIDCLPGAFSRICN